MENISCLWNYCDETMQNNSFNYQWIFGIFLDIRVVLFVVNRKKKSRVN